MCVTELLLFSKLLVQCDKTLSQNTECLSTHQLVLSMRQQKIHLNLLTLCCLCQQLGMSIMTLCESLLAFLDQLLSLVEVSFCSRINRTNIIGACCSYRCNNIKCYKLCSFHAYFPFFISSSARASVPLPSIRPYICIGISLIALSG